MPATHRAAVIPQQGGPLSVVDRTTPEPGPNEILIQVKAVALNLIDHYQRDLGIPPIPSYPAIPGCDTSGIVAKVGVEASNALAVGTRVLAWASFYFENGSADHGAFQEYALVPSEAVVPIPDTLSFEEGAVYPAGVLTAMSGWKTVGILPDTKVAAGDKQAVLVWGASTSNGSYAVQSAKSMGFTVFATASTKNHEYIKSLGADQVFDYHDEDVVSQIVDAVGKTGVTLRMVTCASSGSLQGSLDILKHTKGDTIAKVAYTPMLPPDHPTLEGVEITFNHPPLDPVERKVHFQKCFQGWLREGLKAGTIVPSPRLQVEEGGLEGLNAALDKLKAGVSATKLVLPI